MKVPSSTRQLALVGLLGFTLTSAAYAQPLKPVAFQGSAPFRTLTDNLNEVANFNVEPHRGMVMYGFNAELWAINVHGSTLHRFVGAAIEPLNSYPTLLNPVSIALWEDQVLVLGSGTHALALHDRLSGEVLNVLDLPSEPFALEVDEGRDSAWITCQGTDELVEVDLINWQISRTFDIPGERPGWISLNNFENDFDGDDEVWVSPEISGNNTIVAGSAQSVIQADGEDLFLFPNGGLPDVDLVRINITSGVMEQIGKDVNTIQFAHRTNPLTGETWQLGAESFNLAFTSEDDHKGIFQANRISITDYAGATSFPVTPGTIRVLDVVGSGVGGNPKTVSHPREILFHPPSGGAWVVSQTGDFLAAFDLNGNRLTALDRPLDDGDIPSQVMFDSTGTLLFVYNWGSNTIDLISLQAGTFYLTLVSYNLGHDPASEAVKQGREIFYDADRSLNDQTTCGSCHPGGAGDSLAWNIQDDPTDPKEVMVTQTLYGIEDSFPHHWRGERNMRDFNAAFEGLLGGALLDETPGAELDQFVAFVNSLTPFANPHADVTREIVDANTSDPLEDLSIGSAVRGQDMFFDTPSDGTRTCVDCHAGFTGSSGDPVSETGSFNPHVNRMEIMQLDNQMDLKDQDVVVVDFQAGPGNPIVQFPVQELGSGWAHNGFVRSLLGFLQVFGQLTPQEQSDGTTFMMQFDTGISRAAHQVYHFDLNTRAAVGPDITGILLPQVSNRWIDVIAFGTSTHAGTPRAVSWTYEPISATFFPDDSTLAARPFSWFDTEAAAGRIEMVFMGVPPGNGERLGIDWDNDGIRNQDEAGFGTGDRNPDSDGDGWEDGYENLHGGDPLDDTVFPSDNTDPQLLFASENFTVANVSKWHVELDEKVRIDATFSTPGGQTWTYRGEDFSRKQTVVFQHREASATENMTVPKVNNFDVSAVFTDLSGNQLNITALGVFTADTMLTLNVPVQAVIGDLSYSAQAATPGGFLQLTVDARVDFKEGGPPAIPAVDHVLIGQVLVRNQTTEKWETTTNVSTVNLPKKFEWAESTLNPIPVNYITLPGALQGEFLVLPPTDSLGRTSGTYTVSGLTPGQEVRFVVRIVQPVPQSTPAYDPLNPVFTNPGPPIFFDLPTTPKEFRKIDTSY